MNTYKVPIKHTHFIFNFDLTGGSILNSFFYKRHQLRG